MPLAMGTFSDQGKTRAFVQAPAGDSGCQQSLLRGRGVGWEPSQERQRAQYVNKVASLQCMLHCPIRFHIQSTESKIKLSISWQSLQSINPKSGDSFLNVEPCATALVMHTGIQLCSHALGRLRGKTRAPGPQTILTFCVPQRWAIGRLK